MKRIAIYLTISHFTFTCGLAVASFWNGTKVNPEKEQLHSTVLKQAPTNTPPPSPPAVIPIPSVERYREIVFGADGLRIITHQRRLKSERLRYEIDVSYPEIVGTRHRQFERLNQRLRKLATDQYQWPMNPSQADLRFYKEQHAEAFNEIDLDYEVRLATDRLLSIYFIGYSYGIGAGHAVQYSFTVNYDLTLKKELKLSDMFKPKSKYLEFIAQYCREELSKQPGGSFIFPEALSPKAKNFESWNITVNGLSFNFDACELAGCAEGKKAVEIPFTALTRFLNAVNSK